MTTTYFGDISLKKGYWDTSWSIFPRKCVFTGRWLMPFTPLARCRLTGCVKPGTLVGVTFSAYWTTPQEHTLQSLKDNV